MSAKNGMNQLENQLKLAEDATRWALRWLAFTYIRYIFFAASIGVLLFYGQIIWTLIILSGIALITGLKYDLAAVMSDAEKKFQAIREDSEIAGFMETLEKIKSITPEAAKDKRH